MLTTGRHAVGSHPSVLKWTHSVVHEPTFVSEWQARENARGLALEIAGVYALSCFPLPAGLESESSRSSSIATVPFDCHVPVLQSNSASSVPDVIFLKPNPNDPAQINEPPPQPDRDPGLRTEGSLSLLDRPYWQQQIWQRLQEEGVTEDIDEGPVLYMNSYFVCHITNRRQAGGRPLRFDRGINSWEDDIRFVWEDMVNMNLPIFVHLVQPEPPFSVAPGTFGTLLIVQNPTPYRAACLTTAVEPAHPHFRITEVAHSFDVILPFRHVLLHAGVIDICDQRRAHPPFECCELRVGRHTFPDGAPVRVHEGIGFVISIPPPMSWREWELHILPTSTQTFPAHEETSLLTLQARRQPDAHSSTKAHKRVHFEEVVEFFTNATEYGSWISTLIDLNQSASNPTSGSSSCRQHSRDFDDDDENGAHGIFDGLPQQRHPGPARDAPAWQHTIWIDLQTYGAVELAEEGLVMHLNSHFVSHERHRYNPEPRPVRITEDLDSWDAVFRTAWIDLLDEGAPLELFPVRPTPPVTMYQGTMGTILLVQHPIHDHRACVITSLIGDLPDARIVETAHSMETVVPYDTVIEVSGVSEICRLGPGHPYVLADLKVGGHLLQYGRDVRIYDGLGLQLLIPGDMGDDPIENDVVDLMTRGSTMSMPEGQSLFTSLHRLGRNACEARIFTFGGGVFDTHLDWYQPAQFWSTVTSATSTPLVEIQLLHLVRNSPEDLAIEGRFAFLLQSQADIPSSPLLRATLVDIEYKDIEQSERKVMWIQNKINRPSLLRILRLESLCWWLTDDCRVWQNGYEIPIHQAEPLAIFDGDHLRISVALRLDLDTCDSSHLNLDDQLHLLQKTIQEGWRHHGVSERVHPALCHSRPALGPTDHQNAQQLRMTFQDRTNIEQARAATLQRRRSNIQEAPVTFHTWFLSGISDPLCTTSRLLNLWNDPLNWHQQARRLWQDKIDANWPFRMVLVDPPVEPEDDGGHILIVQHAHPRERAVLLSTFWHDDVTQLWSREAQFLPDVLDFDSLLRSARVLDGCARQQFLCLGFVGALPMDSQRPIYPRVGTHFELHLAEWAIIDENDLMQRSLQVSSPVHSSNVEPQDSVNPIQDPVAASSSEQFCFNPDAPAFDPERPDIRTQTEFVQDLHDRWEYTAFSWEGEDRSSRILTFFTDHRDPHDRCDVGREIDLYDDYTHWEEIILHRWSDYIDPAEARELHVVSPQPPMLRPQYAACVLIVQAPADDMVSSLISVFEGFQSLQLRSRSAITTHEHITLEDVLDRMNLFWRCAGPTSSHVCQAHFASVPLGNAGYIPGRNGYGIVVQLRTRPPPNLLLVPHAGWSQPAAAQCPQRFRSE